MDKRDEEFLKRINETFRIEADEHLSAFSSGLTDLEKAPSEDAYAAIYETLFREIHSLKGAARSVDQMDVESICQPLESVFAALKNRELTLTKDSNTLLIKTADTLSKLIKETGYVQTVADRQYQRELIRQLKELAYVPVSPGFAAGPGKIKEGRPVKLKELSLEAAIIISERKINSVLKPIDTVRLRISKIDPLLLQAEEFILAKKSMGQRLIDLKEISSCIDDCKTLASKWEAEVYSGSTVLWNERRKGNDTGLNKLQGLISELTRSMEMDKYSLGSMVDNHLEAMTQVLMLPVSSMVAVFPAMVRAISREQEKDIEFIVTGEELEIDKRILDEIKDPLIHLIRNSIDHGIDKPQERLLQNKPAKGTIKLSFAASESGMLDISLSDDGKGINKGNLLKAAVKSGRLSKEASEKLNQEEILSLIYQSGVSTSPMITDLSGRGLGLSIVHEKVERLNGKISLETEINKGTSFHMLLPMTLANFRGILVTVDEFAFILPAVNVERVINADPKAIKTIENHETIRVDNKVISVADLGEVLGLSDHKHKGSSAKEPNAANSAQTSIVVVFSGENRIGFKVDEVLEEQQVLVKGLGSLLQRVRNISGATILGSGRLVPVLYVPDLIKSALSHGENIKVHGSTDRLPEKTKKILVADDSITSRILIKNILETAGYMVITAVDGTDAFTKAKTDEFDLIVSDVDMPRMNGFELITKIRHDPGLSEIPMVLVTALDNRDDLERGVEAGANAYIIKSNFDQTNLLDIIKKLI